jgi:glucose/arabinose dehydrogenase
MQSKGFFMIRSVFGALALSAALLATPFTAFAHGESEFDIKASDKASLTATVLAEFDSAWAMTVLPDGRMLVTEKNGTIWLLGTDGSKMGQITNGPEVMAKGQGGLGDIILHPDFETTGQVYISYVERDNNDDSLSGAAVTLMTLSLTETGGRLSGDDVIWRQVPKVAGNGHYGHRMAVSPDRKLFIASGERQKFSPAQNMASNLGKVVRLNLDGTVPEDNPFYTGHNGTTDQIWTLGHRNPLGIAFDAAGKLWVQEMGPKHGDELNYIERSKNYGYPFVSNGDHYSGVKIPDHDEMPIFEAPEVSWTPAISPAGLMIYSGDVFKDWQGDAFIGGLSSKALIRVSFGEDEKGRPTAKETGRYEWGKRIREVEQGADGAIYVLEDKKGGRLIKLKPHDH